MTMTFHIRRVAIKQTSYQTIDLQELIIKRSSKVYSIRGPFPIITIG